MRELTVQEMNQTNGGIAPLIGLIITIVGTVVRHQGVKLAAETAAAGMAGYSFGKWATEKVVGE